MWDNIKRVFGRSRTIFVNVMGAVAVVSVELSNNLIGFDWDAVAKHETAVVIGFAVQIINVFLRISTTAPVSFADQDVPAVPVVNEIPDNKPGV